MNKDYPVEGLVQLDNYLSVFAQNLQNNAYRAALVAAAAPIRDEARERAHKRSGAMAKSIKTGSARRNQDGSFSISVHLEGTHSFLGYFEEYGVAPHLIASTGKGEGRVAVRLAKAGKGTIHTGVMKIGEDFVSGIISHPGAPAAPFMRPALDAKTQDALTAFAGRIRSYIEGKTGFTAPIIQDEAA